MVYREDEQEKEFREKSRKAISLAMESRWEEAAAVNRELLDLNPNDLESCNRLGKALMELGDTDGARHAFARSLEISPNNSIAKKNLERLTTMPTAPKPASIGGAGTRLTPRLFISDSGKSAQVTLYSSPTESERPFVSPGTPIRLERANGSLTVHTDSGAYVGAVPPKLGRRLICLMEGGNQYEGAVFGSSAEGVKVLLRETFQHPSQRSKVSFPTAEREPEPAATTALAEDIDSEFDVDLLEPPVDLSWAEDDDDDERLGVGVGSVIDGGLMDEPLFTEPIEEEP